jgi:hypothetical protein
MASGAFTALANAFFISLGALISGVTSVASSWWWECSRGSTR